MFDVTTQDAEWFDKIGKLWVDIVTEAEKTEAEIERLKEEFGLTETEETEDTTEKGKQYARAFDHTYNSRNIDVRADRFNIAVDDDATGIKIKVVNQLEREGYFWLHDDISFEGALHGKAAQIDKIAIKEIVGRGDNFTHISKGLLNLKLRLLDDLQELIETSILTKQKGDKHNGAYGYIHLSNVVEVDGEPKYIGIGMKEFGTTYRPWGIYVYDNINELLAPAKLDDANLAIQTKQLEDMVAQRFTKGKQFSRSFENRMERDTELIGRVSDALSKVDVSKVKLNADQVKIAKKVKRGIGSEYSTRNLAENLKKAFAYWTENKNVNFDALTQIMSEIMLPVVDNIYDYSGDTRRRLLVRNKTFVISEETAKALGSLNELNNSMLKYGVAFTTNENYPPKRQT